MGDAMESTPFTDAAVYYDRYRAPYAPGALDHVITALGLDQGTRVLDLGCGPGTLAIPLSRAVAEVVAVDPDGSMLAEGRRLAAEQGRRNIEWVNARAEAIGAELGRFRAVTLGQSLHWMDRDVVLDRLGGLVEEGGGLAILDEGGVPESWARLAMEVAASYLGRRERHPMKHPESEHAPSLRRSRHFSAFTVRVFSHEITRDLPSVLGCVYSSVRATRPMFGDRISAFERDLSQALLRLSPSGAFRETVETAVFVAPKG